MGSSKAPPTGWRRPVAGLIVLTATALAAVAVFRVSGSGALALIAVLLTSMLTNAALRPAVGEPLDVERWGPPGHGGAVSRRLVHHGRKR